VLGIPVGTGTQMLTAFAAMLILFAIPSGLLATRFGRKPIILIGLLGMTVGTLLVFLIQDQTTLLALLALMGGFWALININSLPMVYDLAKSGSIGAYTGLYYFASSAAAITGPIVGGALVDLTSYRTIWPFTAAFLLLAALLMSQVRVKQNA
jgi:MFS family permease